jgi:quinol monooxygenase YgiN
VPGICEECWSTGRKVAGDAFARLEEGLVLIRWRRGADWSTFDYDDARRRAIIGTWQSREQWARWHDDETFKATREQLAGLEDGPSNTVWYDVVEEQG